ncbi:ATP-dependent RNA helicase DHX29 isoform X1 [Pangasianodon hypophthalmus]|uniref:ATP-dependent RNA helicase DHX29 isoform X1 n=1 Tax=Pangasianodon hypophthalmus TaxID=310915 RepID=UPI0023072436|nr:ATP-dependent RNA helicase DHX29 isoform X1 [Pangasianodon hypophthalmus]
MGGKKKKSAPVSSAAGAPDAAAKKQQHQPQPQLQSQVQLQQQQKTNCSKTKAPKAYSLPSSSSSPADSSAAAEKSVLKVVIHPDLEKKIVKLINDHRQEHADRGPISGRITSKKLLDLYTALQKFGFKTQHIEEAMKSSVLYGGDLHSALDWLCLNLRDDELPEGFSQSLREQENSKSRAKFQDQQQEKSQAVAQTKSPKHEEQQRAKVKDDGTSMKEWILRYAEQNLEESSEEEEERNGDGSQSPETDEKFDPNERYLTLTAQLYDAKEMASDAKAKKDKAGQRSAQDRIRLIQQEMKPLESHPLFNPAIKVTEAPKVEKKPPPVVAGNDELNFNLFEQANQTPAEKPEKTKKEPKDIRDFDYTGRSWTGKSPKQFLIDWCRKNLPKSPAPSFQKIPSGRYWKCKVRIQRPDDVLEVCPTILTEDGMQAQHLGATLALYNLVKGQSVHQLLPPPYRDVWLEWRDGEQQQEERTRSAINKPRDQFISRLLARVKQQQPRSEPCPTDPSPSHCTEDSWEALADTEEEEKEDKKKEKEEEEKSRSLFLQLRGSELALRLLPERRRLPVFQHRVRVLEALQRHRVVVIAGETGSGKSTQIPQFILEEVLGKEEEKTGQCNVVVTQPRRISAMSLASRVNQELGSEDQPGSKNSLCGYQIRMENRSSASTRLLYCTTGVLLRKLQGDPLLSSITHIIVDEVHERSVQSDFLLTILKDVIHKRSNLHLILMSATVDCDKFAHYFNRCPVVTIPGKTFPVEVFHLEDIVEETGYVLDQDSEYSQRFVEEEEEISVSVTQKGGRAVQYQETIVRDPGACWDLGPELDHFSSRTRHALQHMNPNKINMELILELLDYLDKSPQFAAIDGAVLLFLPGLAHIQQLYDLLTTDKRFNCKDRYKLVALHSTLSSQDQAAAFTVPPAGVRKIVLSTNIAETGVTIPDVVFVIDTGKTKENRYHEGSQMSSLVETFVSKASAVQRQGRAGRVRNGFCFRLYAKTRFNSFIDYSKPEILRVPLEELCLHIMKCEYGSPEDFLSHALDAPPQQAVCNAVGMLRKIGACQRESYVLTPLGLHLASLPVNAKIGKMLIFGAILGCLEPVATIAAAMSEKSPFSTPMNRKEEANLARDALATANSDHLTIYNAYQGWKKASRDGLRTEMSYCRKHFLNRTALITIESVKQELVRMVQQTGLCSTSLPSFSKQEVPVVVAVLSAGVYDNVGRILPVPSILPEERVACTAETPQGKAQVHPSSVNRNLQTHGWLLYQEKVKYSKVYLRDTTLTSPFPILLFGGDIDVQHRERLVSVDGWIHFQAPVRIGVIFKHLRQLLDSLLERKLANPKLSLEDEKTIQIILELIKSEKIPR